MYLFVTQWFEVAKAVMTTDTFPKLISKEFKTDSGVYRIAGWSKGAGMIHPNMATMLSGVFTGYSLLTLDAKISKSCLDKAVKEVADKSFNSISIDGDTSTNDTFVVMANGASGCRLIESTETSEYNEFKNNLESIAVHLAKLIVRDGEGATKFVEILVKVNQL
jgi:glutamate N-acetyltransferase / amino-acid N-acetyltransferase